MVNCPSCGAPIDAAATTCPYCGAAIPQKEKSRGRSVQPQVTIQQVIQEDPYAKQKEQEQLDKKYRKKRVNGICNIVVGSILLLILLYNVVLYICSSNSMSNEAVSASAQQISILNMLEGLLGVILIGIGVINLYKYIKYKQNKIQ